MSKHVAPITFLRATRMRVGRDQLLDALRDTTASIYFEHAVSVERTL
jgi:hypothetical protein